MTRLPEREPAVATATVGKKRERQGPVRPDLKHLPHVLGVLKATTIGEFHEDPVPWSALGETEPHRQPLVGRHIKSWQHRRIIWPQIHKPRA